MTACGCRSHLSTPHPTEPLLFNNFQLMQIVAEIEAADTEVFEAATWVQQQVGPSS